MTPLIKRHSKKLGLKPGTLTFIGEQRAEQVKITVMDYDEENLTEKEVASVEECFEFRDSSTITWINISGIHEIPIIERLGEQFEIHPLVLEDILNTGQRPKLEETKEDFFIVLKMIYLKEGDTEFVSEQVSIIFGKNYVLSFQEREGDVFDFVRERIRKTVPRIRFMGADYLAYALIDAVVDHYFVALEHLGEQIEEMEDILISDPAPENLEQIHDMKRELIMMRKRIWPLREVVGGVDRSESKLIHDFSRPYIRDLYEHVIQVIDTVETFRDMVSGLIDMYLSSVSNKMNEVMKVLTIIATIFIPLGFLAGVYGMNFDPDASRFNMPELGFGYGYIMFWIIALLIGGGLFMFFKRKRWL
jgi:magnesium transporter